MADSALVQPVDHRFNTGSCAALLVCTAMGIQIMSLQNQE